MKMFKCDICKKEFTYPIEERLVTDEHGVTTTYDLCAPCKNNFEGEKVKAVSAFVKKGNK